jgi:hypothetical protein
LATGFLLLTPESGDERLFVLGDAGVPPIIVTESVGLANRGLDIVVLVLGVWTDRVPV